jgi:preprotein translocase subunit SecE
LHFKNDVRKQEQAKTRQSKECKVSEADGRCETRKISYPSRKQQRVEQ